MTPEQRASQALFDRQDYVPTNPDKEFLLELPDTWITYAALVAKYRAEEESK